MTSETGPHGMKTVAAALDRLGGALGRTLLLAYVGVALLAGAGAWATDRLPLAEAIWAAGTLPVLAVLLVEIIRSLARGDVGLDIVAALSMGAAVAFGETLAAVIVALMYSGGSFLEAFAERRANRAMTALLDRAPRFGWREENGSLAEIPAEAIRAGDRLLVRPGDLVPADGTLLDTALLDESALTGEPLPVRRGPDAAVLSGSTNVGEAFRMRADQPAAASTYAGIVRLVEAAQREKAPMVRLADRMAIGFLGLTLAIAGAAYLATGDPIRALAVLVVATPCPLILAVPIALIAGVDRAARHGVLLKGGRVIEGLAAIDRIVLDKTGTLTHGDAALAGSAVVEGWTPNEALRLAASLDQASNHPVAVALLHAAAAAGLPLSPPSGTREQSGAGVTGTVEGRRVAVGSPRFILDATGEEPPELGAFEDGLTVAVAIDGRAVARFGLADLVRDETRAALRGLDRLGIRRVVLASGDRAAVVGPVAASLGLSAWHGDLKPADKVGIVRAERAGGHVMMVGDGTNDAPALAAAHVGVAMGGRGTAASSEAADAVLLADRLDRIPEVISIARKARAIALQSVTIGLGLSVAGMVAAAFGLLTPVEGALLQEAIDVAVILNALRAVAIEPDRVAGVDDPGADR